MKNNKQITWYFTCSVDASHGHVAGRRLTPHYLHLVLNQKMESSAIVIRDGSLADAEAVRFIAYPIMESFGIKPDPNGLDFELGHFGEKYIGAIAQLIACYGSTIIGSIVLRHHLQNDGKITGFYIDPRYRGQKTGHLLLSETVKRAKMAKLDGIYLDTLGKMEAAVNLYKRFGWKQVEDPPPNSGAEKRYFFKL